MILKLPLFCSRLYRSLLAGTRRRKFRRRSARLIAEVFEDRVMLAAVTALDEPFDNTSQFTFSSGELFSDGDGDFFGIADGVGDGGQDFGMGTAPTGLKAYTGFTDNFLTGMDLDDGDSRANPVVIDWSGIDITGLDTLRFLGDFAEFFDSPGDIDASDFIRVEAQLDGGGFVNILEFRGNGGGSNELFAVDTDGDGVGDGTALGTAAQSLSANISGTGTSLDLRLSVRVNANDEDFGLDNIQIVGDDGIGPTPGVTIEPSGGTTLLTEDGATDTYNVSLASTPSGSVDVTVSADAQTEVSTDGIAFASSVVLTFTDTTAQTITVRAVDDAVDEGAHTGTITHAITATNDPADYPTTLTIDDVNADITDNDAMATTVTVLDETFDNTSQFTFVQGIFFSDTADDYFGLADGSGGGDFGGDTAPNLLTYTGLTGNFLTGQDLDNRNVRPVPIVLEWTGLDITGLTNLGLSADFAEALAADGFHDIDASDFIRIEVQIDGGGFVNVLEFRGNDDGANELFAVDTDQDGLGDGTALGEAAQNVAAMISGEGTLLDVRLSARVTANDEDFAVDNLRVTGESGGAAPGVTITPAGATVDVEEGGVTSTYQVSLNTAPAGAVDMTVTADSQTEVSTDGVTFSSSVVLSFSDETPQTITVRAIDDAVAEGDHSGIISHAITTTADPANYPTSEIIGDVTANITDDDLATLTFTIDMTSISENGGTATGTVTRNTGTVGDLVITLLSSDAGEASVPATVTIPDGSDNTAFLITGVDDGFLDGTQIVTITASATGFADGGAIIDVTDDDVETLSVTVDMTSISENGGTATGTVTRSGDTTNDLIVTLSSSDVGEADVPATVTILSGSDNATFSVAGVDDAIADGTQTVTLTASAPTFVDGTVSIDVTDDDLSTLSVTIDMTTISENGGTATGMVARNTGTMGDLVVMLASDDTSAATVPTMVTILDGSESASFTITAVDDLVVDGTQTATITASAATFVDGTAIINVTDDDGETLSVSFDMTNISENGGTATGTVTRTGSTVGDLVVTLTSSDIDEASVPSTVTIVDGGDSATFTITGVDDALVDGTQTVLVIASAATFNDGMEQINVTDDDVATLSVTVDMTSISENGGTATGTVTRNTGTTGDLVVMLASNDTTEASVPAMVTILDGSDSAVFTITGVDDAIIDGTQTVTLTASEASFVDGTATIDVTDDDVALLSVTLDMASISENGGMATGTVTRNTGMTGDLVVLLASSDPGEASVPAMVTILDGSDSATFSITGVDDALADGTQTLTLTASAMSFADGTIAIDVTDDDVATLTVTVDMTMISENGGAATGTVIRNTPPTGDLVVMLASDDTSEATVPGMVTILDGSDSATFTITGVDDGLVDATQTVTITANAASFVDGTVTLDVTDDDVAMLTVTVDVSTINENGGTAIGTVMRNTGTTGDLVVMLASDDSGEATVPATVTILDGDDSATFPVTGVDDALGDGTQTVTLTATAAGHLDGVVMIDVDDDEAAPVINNPGTAIFFTEDGPERILAPNAMVEDADTPIFDGGTLDARFTSGQQTGDELLIVPFRDVTISGTDVSVAGTLVGVVNLATDGLSISLNADATLAAVQAVLNAVAYTNNLDNLVPGMRDVTFTLSEAAGASGNAVQSITVQAVPDQPIIANLGGPITFVEDGGPIQITMTGTLTDPDEHPHWGGAVLNIRVSRNADLFDRLTIENQGMGAGEIAVTATEVFFEGTAIGDWDGGIGTDRLQIRFTPGATQDAIQALIRAIRYENLDELPTAASKDVQFEIADPEAILNTVVPDGLITVVLQATNDPPVLGGINQMPFGFVEGDAPLTIGTGATFVDSDYQGNGFLMVAITGGGMGDRLSILHQGNAMGEVGVVGNQVSYSGIQIGTISGGVGTSPLQVNWNASATRMGVEAVIRLVQFSNVSEDPGTGQRQVDFVVDDGAGDLSNTISAIIDLAAVNDDPSVADFGADVNGAAGTPVRVSEFVTIDDVDSADFSGGLFRAVISSGQQPGDILQLFNDATLSVVGADVFYNGVQVGTVMTDATSLTVLLNASATPGVVQRLGRNVELVGSGPGTRQVMYQLEDGDGGNASTGGKNVIIA